MNKKTKRLLVIIAEGPTEIEFYKKVLDTIKVINNLNKFNFDKIIYFCASGIGNYSNKMPAKFKNEICVSKFDDYEKVVCLCYDRDVFKVNQNKPPINRIKMVEKFKNNGADDVFEVIADDMIEDFFVIDYEGIKKYLNLKKTYKKPNKNGLELLKQMFKDASKIYTKGTEVRGLVDCLDIKLILNTICNKIEPLCQQLGCNCDGSKCKK